MTSSSSPTDELRSRRLTYSNPGCTSPATSPWTPPSGFRTYERTVLIGHGPDAWGRACDEISQWTVKTRSGFQVQPGRAASVPVRVAPGNDFWLIASLGLITIREPVRVIEVVRSATRCGFSYGTLDGHPVSGEEAFIVALSGGSTFLSVRSVTRPGTGLWRLAFPGTLVAQTWYRRRYLRALQQPTISH